MTEFKLLRKRELIEVKGTLYEYEHIKTKARLAYLETDEENKHFSVSFKTLPENDTGVFHILEHSVLCGSKKYPVKEPFVELLKSSMNTFLNAMTFPDKTMYPVSSKNEKDFFNLMDVYLDAVFNPAIYSNENIFRQEGWHYELRNREDEAIYKGVVLNEMKGALSSVDTLIDNEMMRLLYPNNAYKYVSGGDPKAITDLTYDEFLNNHKKYYHPSNAYFYLEGQLNIEEVLNVIEGYLQNYSYNDEKYILNNQDEVEASDVTCYYPISKDEDISEKTQISFGKVVAHFKEKEKIMAINILSDYLTGSNEAPLKKAILDKQLAQDFYSVITDGILQPFFQIQAVNTKEELLNDIKDTIKETILDILNQGIDKSKLEASLNQMEFNIRDVGEPKALMHNIQALNSWLYDGDISLYLSSNDAFKFLRESLNTSYYEELLKEVFDLDKYVSITMIPSTSLDEKIRSDEKEKLASIMSSLSDNEINKIIEDNNDLDNWQKQVDSKEALDTIPKLSLADISKKGNKIKNKIEVIDNVVTIVNPSTLENIVNLSVYIELDVVNKEELHAYSFLPNLLKSLPTKRSLTKLLYDIKANVGRLNFDLGSTSIPGDNNHVRVFLIAKASVLENKVSEAVRLIKEVLFDTNFKNYDLIKALLVQLLEGFRNDIQSNGHRYAMRRVLSSYSKEAYFNEVVDGVEAYYYLSDLIKNFDEKIEQFTNHLTFVQNHLLSKNRITISIATKNYNDDMINKCIKPLISIFNDEHLNIVGSLFEEEEFSNIGISISSGVSYGAIGSNLYALNKEYDGALRVISTMLSYDYLWNEVRVKGGAYGTGFASGSLGTLSYYSYRDPNIKESISIYKNAGDYIREIASSNVSLDQFIISSIAKLEPLRSIRSQSDLLDGNYFRQISYDYESKLREDMFTIDKDKLLEIASILDDIKEKHKICIIANSDELDKCKDLLDEIKTL